MRLAIGSLLSLLLVAAAQGQQNRYPSSSPLPLIKDGAAPAAPPARQQPISSSFDGINTGGAPPLPSSQSPVTAPATTRPALSATGQPASPARNERFARGSTSSATPTQALGYEPSQLMRGMLNRPSDSQLGGSPVRLEEVVSRGQSRADQTRLINAYWDLCSSTADYYLGLAEAEELRRLQQRAGASSPTLNEAINQWRTRIGTSRLAAIAAQRKLASAMGTATLPLPGDPPLCGAYKTRYSQVFAGRESPEAYVLDQLIPLRYAELSAAATAVSRSEQFANSVKQRDPTGEGMVRALELLALNRRAFVQIAKDYNRQITRYTELSTPGKIDTDRLVAMLVERPKNASTASQSRPLTFRPGLQ